MFTVLPLMTLFLSMVSQSLMDLVGTIFVIGALISIYRNREEVFPKVKDILTSKYFLFFYAWVLWVLISFLVGAATYERLVGRVLEFRWIGYLFCYVYCVQKLTVNHFRYFAYSLAIMCLLSLHIYVSDVNYITGNPIEKGIILRAGGFLNDPMALAHGLGAYVAFLFGYFSKREVLFKKTIALSLIPILAVVLLSMTRGVWIAVVVAFAVYFFIKSWRQFMLFAVSVLILAGVGYSFSANFRARVDQAINFKTSYDTERIVLWETNWYIVKNNPIFGIGYGENKHRLREFYDILNVSKEQFQGNAHNQYLNFLAGTGAIGILFYLIWVFTNLYWAYKLSVNKNVSIDEQALGFGSFLAQIVFIVGGLTESNFEHSKIKTIIAFFWAISFYSYYITKIKNASKAKEGSL